MENILFVIISLLELLSVLLLAVEAIKINNFRNLRDHIITPFYRKINPEIVMVDDDDDDTVEPQVTTTLRERILKWLTPSWFVYLHLGCVILGVLTLFVFMGIFYPYSRLIDVGKFLFEKIAPGKQGFLFADLFFLYLVAQGVGMFMWMLVCKFFDMTLSFINFIEGKTPSGTVGVLGFFLFSIAFFLKMYIKFNIQKG